MDPWTLFLTLSVVILGLYYLFFAQNKKFEKLGIPHMKPWPIFGNMAPALFQRCPVVQVVTDAYNLSDEADYVGLYDFSDPIIVIRSPTLIKNIAVRFFDHFVDHRGFVTEKQDPLFGKNLFSLRGEKWKETRSLLTPSFTSSKMKGMFKLIWNCAENFTDYLKDNATIESCDLDVKDAFTRYTNDVIATCAFGITTDSMRDPKNNFYVLGRRSTKLEGILTLKFFLLSAFPKLFALFRIRLIDPIAASFFENIVTETIEKRDKEGITRPDMIQLMMETRNNKTGPSLTIEDMAAQAFGFFFAGFDTSSAFMCFLAHELAINDDVQTRLRDEIDAILEENNGDVSYEAINGMQYLEAVINEGLRKYPGAPFLDRTCVKSFELPPAFPGAKPIIVEPGSTVWFPVFSIHRDPKYYADPDKFDPERFMDGRKSSIDPFTYFPFGQGPRMCIGYRFALLESKIVFFNLLAKCCLKRCSKTVVPIRISKKCFALTAEGGFWLKIEARKSGKVDGDSESARTNGAAKCS